jgi:hypothetical protein
MIKGNKNYQQININFYSQINIQHEYISMFRLHGSNVAKITFNVIAFFIRKCSYIHKSMKIFDIQLK